MKNFHHYSLFCLFFFVSLHAISQNSVTGTILDPNRNAVPFANVVLLQAKDSTTVYRGTVSNEDGSFEISNVEENEYMISVSFVGFDNYLKKIKVSGDQNLRNIILQETQNDLDEVTITAQRPTIEKKIDRLVFNVENTTLSTGDSWDILKHTPGVIVSQGNLLIKNQPAEVYINDRKVYLTSNELQQLLQGFSGNNVKSVEVITTPPAKYDAEGGAILNIVTSKNISVGYKGDINAYATAAIKPKYSVGTSQYYKNDWLNAYASYNFNSRFDYKEDTGKIVYFEPNGNVDSRWFNNFRKNTRTYSHSLNSILDFTLNDNNTLSFSTNLLFTPKKDSDIDGRTEIYMPQGSLDSLYTTNSQLEDQSHNLLFNADYTSKLNDKGAELSIKANYINYKDDQTQDLKTRYLAPDESLLGRNSFYTLANQYSDIYTGQLDLTTTLAELSFETGLKYSGINSDSGLDFFDTNGGSRNFNSALSDEFNYKENIYAGYASITKDWEKWILKAGFRGEYTDVSGTSISLGLVNSQNYFELFPTIYLMHNPFENHSFSLEYTRRITRPRFQSLNPYRYFLNENNFQVGNPNIQPGITNKINFDYTYKSKLSFDLYWERTNNALAVLPYQNNTNHTLRTVNDNVDFDQQYSLDIGYYTYFNDWWSFSLSSSFFYLQTDFFALESQGQTVTNDVFSTYLQVYNGFTLSKDGTFTGDLFAFYLPGFVSGSYQYQQAQYNVSIGLRKTFFDGRLTTSVNVEDIFNSVNIPLRSNYLNQDNSFFAMPESRYVRFGIRYRFGNFKLKDNQRAIEVNEAERLEEKEKG